MKKVDINNLKQTVTTKQAISFNSTKFRRNGEVITGTKYLNDLVDEGYNLAEGNKNSYILRKENSDVSVVLNAVEAKVFQCIKNGGKGKIQSNGYSTYILV